MPKQPKHTYWTADTCTAFLMALRFHGTAKRAAAEIGRSFTSAYKRRERDQDFAARWDAMLDEWRAVNVARKTSVMVVPEGDRAMPNRERFDGFTPQRQRAFLRALTETGTYEDACRQVRVTTRAALQMRNRYPEFAAACERALGQSVSTLEQAAIDRAVQGVEEPVWHAGKIVGYRVVRSDSLLGKMLDRGRGPMRVLKTKKERYAAAAEAATAAGGTFERGKAETSDEVFAKIALKLDRLAAHWRQEAAAQAEAWLAEGRIP